MLKICLMMLSLLFVTNTFDANTIQFEEDISKAYEVYAEYIEFPNTSDSFYLKIVRGKVNDKWCYGVCFTNSFAKTYSIKIVDENNNVYSLPQDKRGDINAVAIEVNKVYTINVYRDGEKISLYKKAELVPFEEEEFALTDSKKMIFGENKGTKFIELKSEKQKVNSDMFYILVAFGAITLGCVIIIVAFAKMKKGMFSKEKRSEGVFNFKEFLSEDFNEEPKNEFDIIDIAPVEEKDEELNSEREIYQKMFRYDDDEVSGFKIKEYLQDKGFVIDYKLASEEEKQKIMLELMKLKNDKKITEDEYLEEAYRLWKE